MSEAALKCENNCANFQAKLTLKLIISSQISYFSVLALDEI